MLVCGEEPETFLASLDRQKFVERVLVIERRRKRPCGMERGHRRERHSLIFERGDGIVQRETALPCARRVAGVAFEAHFPDRRQARIEPAPGAIGLRRPDSGRSSGRSIGSYRPDVPRRA